MKKLLIVISLAAIGSGLLFAQPALVYQMHSLQAGVDNPMIYSVWVDPGQGGADVLWDFRQLQELQPFTGFLKNASVSTYGATFSSANTELTEFDSRFYFKVTSTQTLELGYSSDDGKTQIRYTSPVIKMKFPFCYGDMFTGSFSGNSFSNGVSSGNLSGDYSVEADGYGSLILPGNRYFENTLRIKSQKSYSNNLGSIVQQVNIVTYRWYDLSHRYPLLVLTEYSVSTGGTLNVYHQAAYNNKAALEVPVMQTQGIALYPNPTRGELILTLDAVVSGNLKCYIYDVTGTLVRSFPLDVVQTGSMEANLSDKLSGLKPAGYILVINNGDSWYRKNFTLVE
jgi:hypothetical protein